MTRIFDQLFQKLNNELVERPGEKKLINDLDSVREENEALKKKIKD